ncbi:MAG TPA: hypothetical protein VGF79_16160, partial [Bacteroidia bacterium]
MKNTILLLFAFLQMNLFASDSISLNNRFDIIERNVKQIETNQLNYKIEKDLLKETYSNNYERINLIITIVLALIAILGALGIKDINNIQKNYKLELERLNNLRDEFNQKSVKI